MFQRDRGGRLIRELEDRYADKDKPIIFIVIYLKEVFNC